MGGACSFYLIDRGGKGHSLSTYNSEMSYLVDHYDLMNNLLTKEQEDKLLSEFISQTNTEQYYHDPQNPIGMAPDWYGLIVFDLMDKKVFSFQYYTSISTIDQVKIQLLTMDNYDYGGDTETEDEIENYRKWFEDPRTQISNYRGEVVEKGSWENFCHYDLDINSRRKRMVLNPDNWEINEFQDIEEMFEAINSQYTLSVGEMKIWKEFMKKDEDENEEE